jgi:hypothetical protein
MLLTFQKDREAQATTIDAKLRAGAAAEAGGDPRPLRFKMIIRPDFCVT